MVDWIKEHHNNIDFDQMPFRFNLDVIGLVVSDMIEN